MGWDAPAFYLTTVWLAATIKRQRHLRRILQKLGLKRRSDERSISTIFSAVKVELQHWSPAKGIRAMHRRIRDERKIQPCYRNDVNQAMKQFDATGLRMRTPGKCKIERKNYFSKGPNDVWHIDGNDKLKFYGIWVHLGIDGFSRRIIWLQAGTSNRKPGFIARYYLDAVIRENGCPQLVRADRGKENKLVALLQTSFRQRHCDSLAGINSFRYGKSVHNQRAECFNSYLKKSWICLWQERFEKMVGSDILDISNPVHIHCLQFSFLQLIQNELKLEAMEWNNHNIRKQRGVVGPFGKPELLYYSPPEGQVEGDYSCCVVVCMMENFSPEHLMPQQEIQDRRSRSSEKSQTRHGSTRSRSDSIRTDRHTKEGSLVSLGDMEKTNQPPDPVPVL
ncbi:uncharacterized protein [Ranitomeya imitator]|uniref:uncharacterized protein n=1 Tax=Ranitomeya imitator TaxID=111125 RepID=UPI0037E93DFA